jgi:hypothetical protein
MLKGEARTDQKHRKISAQIYLITEGLSGPQVLLFSRALIQIVKCGNYSCFCFGIGCAVCCALPKLKRTGNADFFIG